MSAATLQSTLLFVLGLGCGINAFQMNGRELVRARLDPIVSPGKVSSHVHAVLGGSNFGPTVSSAGLRQSQCSTISTQQDKSAYWTAPPYGKNKDGTFSALPLEDTAIYYTTVRTNYECATKPMILIISLVWRNSPIMFLSSAFLRISACSSATQLPPRTGKLSHQGWFS